MHEDIRKETFRELIHHPEVFTFCSETITQSYQECTPGYVDEMRALLEQVFALLQSGKEDETLFRRSITTLVSQVFRKGDPDFWFNHIYKEYKRTTKPEKRYRILRDYLMGETVLDMGCGDGLTSEALSRHGYQVFLTDVLDYRDERSRHLPFHAMTGPHTLPDAGRRFDSAIVMAVFHHVAVEDLSPILQSLRRAARRLVVEEDCYAVPANFPGLEHILESDDQLRRFTELPVEDQLRSLMFIDFFANAITQGIPEMDMPFNFRTVQGWQELFESQGFSVVDTLLLGFQKGNFNRSCHVWFVLDSQA